MRLAVGRQVKEADDYLDDVEAKLAKMYNRNKHAEVLDASAKAKGHCQRCNKTVTEDEVWVNALDKTFHKKCAWLLHACSRCLTCAPQTQASLASDGAHSFVCAPSRASLTLCASMQLAPAEARREVL